MPKISIAIPYHNMENVDYFLVRLIKSLNLQTFRDFEIVLTKEGKMAENTNASIKKSKGDIIKIMYVDDYFTSPISLQSIVDSFNGGWLATGCLHDDGFNIKDYHEPSFDGILEGLNTIGSPSVIAFENKDPLMFDENMSWLLDLDYYKRLYTRYGQPTLLNSPHVVIGIGRHQMTHILTNEQKLEEHQYLNKKYE